MKVRLAYGETGLTVELPDTATTVVTPVHHAAAPDQTGVLRAALRDPVSGPPLREGYGPARPSPSRPATSPAPSRGT